jgi:hypothetical protein
MAVINGKQVVFEGRSFEEIGEELLRFSPEQDGSGLDVSLTEGEEAIFESIGGLTVGKTITTFIADAVRARGRTPRFGYQYANLSFKTTAT